MNVSCNIIEDLLPLYADGLCSEDSRRLVDEHTEGCTECKAMLEAMTAKLDTPPPPSREVENTKLFRVLHKQYIRLGIITLVICAAVLIPAVILGILYVNEETHQGVSFSTLALEHDMRKVGSMMKKGEYRAALDIITLPNEDGYDDTQLSAYKDAFAEDMEKYFGAHPIARVRTYTKRLGAYEAVRGYLFIELEGTADNIPVRELDFSLENGEACLYYTMFGVYAEYDAYNGFYCGKEGCEPEAEWDYTSYRRDFPNLLLPEADFASERYFSRLSRPDEIDYYTVVSMEKYLSFDGESFFTEAHEYFESLPVREFAEKYIYLDCRCGLPQYTADERGRYYIQQADLRFIADGETVTVSCILPFDKSVFPFRLSAVQDIVYSENAPQDFRDTFERIFGE
ncbi:MAG: zf-HC2 domain-containing protein [Oscillospiraceae bacterium]